MAEPKTAEEGHDDLKAHTKECDCEACKAGKPSDPEFLEVHKRLAAEWIEEMQNLDISKGSKGFKSNMLPFSRVKKLMKANQEVKMVRSCCPNSSTTQYVPYRSAQRQLSYLPKQANCS